MAGTHYVITASELENHPDLQLLRHPNTLSLYYAAKLLGRDFLCSTSGWSGIHLRALKVLQFVNLPLDRICPSTHIIDETSGLAQSVRTTLSLPPMEVTARRHNPRAFEAKFYDELALLLRITQRTPSPHINRNAPRRAAITTSVAMPTPTTSLAVSPNPEDDNILSMSFQSDDSGSTYYPSQSSPRSPRNDIDEATAPPELREVREIVTNSMIVAFLQVISTLMYPDFNPVKPRPEFNMLPDHIKLVLMGASLTSENDGSGWKTRWSKSGGQYVNSGGAPLITVEAKRRTHQMHPDEILAREVGELLAILNLKNAHHGFANELNRQAYIISAHHTKAYISTVHVTQSYYESCNTGTFRDDDYFLVRCSQVWDLAEPSDRYDAALAVLAILQYTMAE